MTTFDLAVCVGCLSILASGEYDDAVFAALTQGRAMVIAWGPGDVFEAGTEDLGWSDRGCEICGDPEPGDRYAARWIIKDP